MGRALRDRRQEPHALVDGVEAVDITTVLFDTEPSAPQPTAPRPWSPSPLPSAAKVLGDALFERVTRPQELARTARAVVRTPRHLLRGALDGLQAMGALASPACGRRRRRR